MDEERRTGKLVGWATFIRTRKVGSRQRANHVDRSRGTGGRTALILSRKARFNIKNDVSVESDGVQASVHGTFSAKTALA
jgi:hypothetical protein